MMGQLGDFQGLNMNTTLISTAFSKLCGRPNDMVKSEKLSNCLLMNKFQSNFTNKIPMILPLFNYFTYPFDCHIVVFAKLTK